MNLVASLLLAASATSASPMELVQWPVDDGTTAVLVEDHRAPLVHLWLEFPVGSWSAWGREVHAEEAFEIQLHDRAGILRRRADLLAAQISLEMGPTHATLHASCLTEDFPKLLQLVRDLLRETGLDRAELGRRRKQRAFDWSAASKQPMFVVAQAAARVLYADADPRRLPWERPPRTSAGIPQLVESRDLLIRLPGRLVAFAGDLDRASASAAAADLLPALLVSPPPFDSGLPEVASERASPGERTARLPKLSQVYFAYVRDSLTHEHPDYPAILVADHVLGGHFYSRLYVALRHEGGDTYGAWTRGLASGGLRPYSAVTFTRADNSAHAEQKLERVLEQFHDRGITESERRDAVGYLLGRRAFRRQAPEQIVLRFLAERRMGLDVGQLDRLVDRAAQLPLDAINRAVAEYYDPARFTLVRVVPR